MISQYLYTLCDCIGVENACKKLRFKSINNLIDFNFKEDQKLK